MSSIRIALAVDAQNPVINDLFLTETGTLQLTQNLSQEVAQKLFIRLRMFQGEWFLDPTVGVPYFQSILGVKQDRGIVEQIFRYVITRCPGVQSLTVFDLKAGQDREISLNFSCILADGTTLNSSDFGPFVVPVVS